MAEDQEELDLNKLLEPIHAVLMGYDLDTYINLRLALAPRRFFQLMCGQSSIHQQLFVECVKSDYWRYHAVRLGINAGSTPTITKQ